MHLILDYYATHKYRKVQAWRSAHPRSHFYLTPTYASWLNQIEHWFSALQRQVLANGSHDSTRALQRTLGHYVRGCDRIAVPPFWRATAESILVQLAITPTICETVQ